MKALKHLNKYFLKYKYRLIIGVLITIISKIFALFTPRLVGASINVVSDYLDGNIAKEVFKSELTTNVIYIAGAAIIAGVFIKQTELVI